MFFKANGATVAQATRVSELEAKLAAIARSQAVVEFELDGSIIAASDSFLAAMGYSAAEVVGRHHRMFVDPAYAASAEYQQFWSRLSRGEAVFDKFRHLGKGGREVWIQASYSPMMGPDGRAFRVIKVGADISALEQERLRIEADRARVAAEQDLVVKALTAGLSRLAASDLTAGITDPVAPAYETVRSNFNEAAAQLRQALSVISDYAGAMKAGAGEISQATDDLSRRTEQQAAALEETAAALDEITAAVRKTAEGAQQANKVVNGARMEAEKSGLVVREAVAAMGEIEQSARQISQIIGVIDEIAFQTNLLALNAGVEAARAGDAGRGFAVVAQEVRALAQRSAEAAKEIKALISASSQQVSQGVTLVGQTGDALQRIVTGVSEITGLVAEITASTQEQATGLSHVNTAVNQMDRGAQENAAMVEQASAASHTLNQQVEALAEQISRFSLSNQPGGATLAPVADRAAGPRRPAPVSNPVHRVQSRVAAFAAQYAPRRGATAGGQAAAAEDWEEF
ncbi:MAG TPA: PAS domain-containing methyl-accepting chemotaxis protein [Caulobacter sp.]|nr:PAS domain-containing methyl-accepting chemotaxis protein [Caulobacter sp.]